MEETKVKLLEGLLPVDLWNTIVVLLILFGVFMVVFKGIVAIRDEIEKHRKKKKLSNQDITDQIADKVLERIQPTLDEQFGALDKRFEEIDKKLDSDKKQLDSHTDQLNDHENRVGRLEGGDKALCHGMLALLERDPTLVKAQNAMKTYLIDGKYDEGSWK